MLQNATPLRKSAPGLPNSSDEHVSCTAPATRNASCQILCICPTPAIVFETGTKPRFLQGAQSLAPATRNDIWTSKIAPNLATFSLLASHRATTARTFSTSQLPKVVRTWCVLYILTSKCASRRNSVHFFDISTSTSAPNPSLLTLLTLQCASRHNGVQFFISHLASWLRTRRFSEPTFRPSGATNHWKNTMFCDFPTFSRTWIFFLRRLSLFDLLSSSLLFSFWYSFFFSSLLFSDSSHLCFSCVNIVGSLTSKLPSIKKGC